MRWMNPLPSSPRRFACGTRTSVKDISEVSCAARPTLLRLRPRSNPGVSQSTMKSETPFEAGTSGLDRATTTTQSQF